MDDAIEVLTRGHVTEVKIVLTAIVVALALYQVFLMAVGYGKLRLPFLKPAPASRAHRSVGDTVVPITLLIGLMCLGYFEVEDGYEHARPGEHAIVALHIVAGFALVGVIALKIAVVRWWHSLGRLLPLLGISVLTLFLITWFTSSARYL